MTLAKINDKERILKVARERVRVRQEGAGKKYSKS